MLLHAMRDGDSSAAGRLLPLVYAELRALASRRLRDQRVGHTLQPTALVHEAFLKLVHQPDGAWNDRAHFFAVAASAMRSILADHARRRAAAKRGGGSERIGLDEAAVGSSTEFDVLQIDELLQQLAQVDPMKHKIVEMRFFAGMTLEEIADVLSVSKTTIESEWRATRAWLAVKLKDA